MSTLTIEDQLSQIQESLAAVQDELSIIRRTRDEIQDLKEDLSIVVKDVFKTLVLEMEEISPYIDNGELVDMLKRTVRNTGSFNKLLIQLESIEDFITDATPVGKAVLNDAIAQMQTFQEKGYFDYARELGGIMDNITENFSPEDVRLLSENVVTILQTVKSLTQPDMLLAVNNAATVFKHLDPVASKLGPDTLAVARGQGGATVRHVPVAVWRVAWRHGSCVRVAGRRYFTLTPLFFHYFRC